MPSGTMAQQIALRVHADRRNRRTVLYHPQCHLAVHELGAAERLHGLHGRAVGDRNRLISIDDLRATADGPAPIAEAPAALLLELPQRDLGGQLPAWDELVGQVDWAHSVGAAAHLDGARLWQCGSFYDRPLDAIAALFDTVYVSFYKDIGAFAGAAVAGPADVIAEAREWQQRHGGRLYSLWPHAASALAGLRARLPRMPAYRAQALALADALRDLPGLQLVPDPPHASMFHVVLHRDADALQESALRLAKEEGICTWGRFQATEVPGVSRAELSVGDATLEWTPAEFREVIVRLLKD
jgi:threonine aldolase